MSRNFRYPVSLLSGLILNIGLVAYVYFVVEGGPVALKQGGDWPAILNEIPQTVLIFSLAILLPYWMVWSRRMADFAWLSRVGRAMLAETLVCAALVASFHEALYKELTMDIGWVMLWGVASYFVLIAKPSSRQ